MGVRRAREAAGLQQRKGKEVQGIMRTAVPRAMRVRWAGVSGRRGALGAAVCSAARIEVTRETIRAEVPSERARQPKLREAVSGGTKRRTDLAVDAVCYLADFDKRLDSWCPSAHSDSQSHRVSPSYDVLRQAQDSRLISVNCVCAATDSFNLGSARCMRQTRRKAGTQSLRSQRSKLEIAGLPASQVLFGPRTRRQSALNKLVSVSPESQGHRDFLREAKWIV